MAFAGAVLSAERPLLKGSQVGDGGDLKTASSFIGPFGYGYGYPYFGYGKCIGSEFRKAITLIYLKEKYTKLLRLKLLNLIFLGWGWGGFGYPYWG